MRDLAVQDKAPGRPRIRGAFELDIVRPQAKALLGSAAERRKVVCACRRSNHATALVSHAYLAHIRSVKRHALP